MMKKKLCINNWNYQLLLFPPLLLTKHQTFFVTSYWLTCVCHQRSARGLVMAAISFSFKSGQNNYSDMGGFWRENSTYIFWTLKQKELLKINSTLQIYGNINEMRQRF